MFNNLDSMINDLVMRELHFLINLTVEAGEIL